MTSVMAAVGLIGVGFGTGSATADVANGGTAPMRQVYRSCDFSVAKYVDASGYGSGHATIGTGGSGTVTADVFLMIGRPNTPYQVRLIQGPRPGSQTCNAGDPGVMSAVLNTDGNGTGSVTLRDAVRSGATNAWVFVDGPPDPGEIRGEFYTSEVLTSLQ
ncbi:hypothetical protein [Mycobacterium sp. ITM-2016-00318]|uniref:hypothetical protein n=1 Tax=Mycobacterium sp. ITM-2016-00318 TaxID=2099693 RepID=UPI000CFA62F8|nr:hypothetical protein [Mycobacterium sp. ITM-2016-00318]WNG93157.1 hypothetical protein C6A82_001300 [Mycobacterium sp. ITM-2016-00318]